jgi:putative drug exporter of the RND superfamily
MKLNTATIARASSRHPWRTITIWLIALVAMGGLSNALLADVLTQDISFTNKPESVKAQDVIDQKFTSGKEPDSTEFVIIQSDSLTVDDPQFQSVVKGVQDKVAALGSGILAAPALSYYDVVKSSKDQAASLVSGDRKATLVTVPLKKDEDTTIQRLRSIADQSQTDGFTVQVAGQGTLQADFTKIAEEDLKKGESIGIAIALIVLIVVFASIVAAVTPIVMALFAITIALGLVSVIGQVVAFNLFVTNMVTMIGLAVGIDYSLFIVSRYREERKKGHPKLEAIARTGGTANRAVFFSGLTVVLALLGMFILPTTIFRSLATGAILVTISALAASMTLLPAILGLLGDKINWPRLSKRARVDSSYDPRGGIWDRLTRGVMARPAVFLIGGVLVLGALGSYYFQLHRGTSQNVSQLSDDFPSKQAFLTLEREFSGGVTDPVRIVVTGDVNSDATQAAITKLRSDITSSGAFASQTQVTTSKDGTAVEVDAFLKTDPSNDAAFDAIRTLRSDLVPAAFGGVSGVQVLVGGNTAFFTDFLDVVNTYQWIVLAFVLGLSFLLLTVVFRSVVVPATAIVMNLLSVGAAYGALTLVFQKGVGIGFFNALGFQFQQSGAIEAWLPLFLFSVLFGLSMDYQVFLISRIREEYDKTRDNTEAVAYGLRTTAGIITGAALIMVAVFTGFAAGRLGPLQQMGFGLAVAVFMDATIVRTILVPATMRLLGDRNWYLPKWLGWLPQLHVEGIATPEATEVEGTEPVPAAT